MNAELTKVFDVLSAIESYPNKVFDSLTTFEKLEFAAVIRGISPDMDYKAVIDSVVAIYADLDSGITGLTISEKFLIAAKVRRNETGGSVTTDAIVAGVAAVEATGTLTIGGETDSDIAVGDIIKIWQVAITAVADDATPGVFEFCVDTDKDTVIDNIIDCLGSIPGKYGFPFIVEAGTSPTITVTAKEAGVAGNTISTAVVTEGTTAFGAETLEDGADEVMATPGVIGGLMVDDDDNVYVMTNTGYKPVTLTAE